MAPAHPCWGETLDRAEPALTTRLPSRFLRRFLLAVLAGPILLVILEAGYFAWILTGPPTVQRADLIVVFEGRDERTREAYRLADLAYAPNLVVSPASPGQLDLYDQRYLPSQPVVKIVEDKSRTTLENALHTKEILERNHFRSAILVTSWDHMPRSFFLLEAMIAGSCVRVQPHAVATGPLNPTNWYRHTVGWKMVYNEMVEFWGSLVEFVRYRISGELPAEAPGKSGLAYRLKQILLFKIDFRSLQG